MLVQVRGRLRDRERELVGTVCGEPEPGRQREGGAAAGGGGAGSSTRSQRMSPGAWAVSGRFTVTI